MGFRPHILFTTDEEVGCQGSKKAVEEKLLEEFSEASMLIQVDRGVHEGYWNEMVFYNYDKDSIPEIYEELSKYYIAYRILHRCSYVRSISKQTYCKPLSKLYE